MIKSDLINFIKEEKEKGKQEEDIRQALLLQGWRDIDIDEGFQLLKNNQSSTPPPSIIKESNMNFKALFSESIKIFKKNFGKFWLATIIYGIVGAIVGIGIVFASIKIIEINLYLGIIMFVLAALIISIIASAGQITYIFISTNNDNNLSFVQILKKGLRKMFPFWVLNILISGIILAVAFPIMGIILALIASSPMIFIFIGILLLSIIITIISTYLSQASFIFALENETLINSILKSKHYIKNNWWVVFSKILLLGIAIFIFMFLINLFFGIFLTEEGEKSLETIINVLIITPISVGYSYAIYKNLKKKKEGIPFSDKHKNLVMIVSIIGIIISMAATIFIYIYMKDQILPLMDLLKTS